jgi:DNA-binding HxlR family transcriptional regulator
MRAYERDYQREMSLMGTSSDEPGRVSELERQMQEVTRRLAIVEQAASLLPQAVPGPATQHGPGGPALRPERQQSGDGERDSESGEATVGYWGVGQFGGHRMGIRHQATLSQVFAAEPEAVTPVFAALASPARIALLGALVGGSRTSQQLREVLDDPSVGQLYHHLRELLAAGLVVQPSRSVYAIPPGKLVAVCVAVSAAAQLTSFSHQYPPPPAEPAEDGPPPGPPEG